MNHKTEVDLHPHYALIEKAIMLLEQEASSMQMGTGLPEPSLDTLATRLHTSAFHLQRVFSAWAGLTPKQFFQCLQQHHARQLLASGHSMQLTSDLLGLASTSKLHRLMLKFEAMSPGEIKNQGKGLTLTIGHTESPFGRLFVGCTPKGLNSLEFQTPTLDYTRWSASLRGLYPQAHFLESHAMAQETGRKIFQPSVQASPSELVLHLRGTEFQLMVWQALLHVPAGQLVSYQQLAHHLGKPSASRAVGSAIARNSIAYLIPCHRVIQATGHLGQYRWHSARKKALHLWEQGQLSLAVI